MRKHDDDDPTLRDHAKRAIDEEELQALFDGIAGDDVDREAIQALRAVAVDELLETALAAVSRSERRGRSPTGDDVGAAADDRHNCCGPSPPAKEPLSLKVEW